MNVINYKPAKCSGCTQTLTYLLAIDRGTVDILKAIATAIRNKGVNMIHPRKEMEVADNKLSYQAMVEEGLLTSNQVGNLSRPRFHGLIARVKLKGKRYPGNYLLTAKGAKFLKGEDVPQFAIISKVEKHNIGYFEPERYMVNIKNFRPDHEYWDGIDFTIEDGEIIKDISEYRKAKGQGSMFPRPSIG